MRPKLEPGNTMPMFVNRDRRCRRRDAVAAGIFITPDASAAAAAAAIIASWI